MKPKIHDYGHSFMGVGKYVLHDKYKAKTDDRVEWVETRNIGVDVTTRRGRNLAFRVMAATAMDADRLKAEAGVKSTGRKSKAAVMHFTLSWHDDDAPDRAEMVKSAEDAIAFLGGCDRQAVITSHNDGKPHVHIVLNRVSMADGLLLSKWTDRRKLSDWASDYERSKNCIRSPLREENRRLREEHGITTYAYREKPRHIWEKEQKHKDSPHFEAYDRRERALDKAVSTKGRELAHRQAQELSDLDEKFITDRRQILADTKTARKSAIRAAKLQADPELKLADQEHARRLADAEMDEISRLQPTREAFTRFDPAKAYQEAQHGELSTGFNAHASEDSSRIREEANQKARRAILKARERSLVKLARQHVLERKKAALKLLSQRRHAEQRSMKKRHARELTQLKADWSHRNQERKRAIDALPAPDILRHHQAAVSSEPVAKRTDSDQHSPTLDHDSAREKYIRETTGKGNDRSLDRDEYIRKTRDQDNQKKEPDPDRDHD